MLSYLQTITPLHFNTIVTPKLHTTFKMTFRMTNEQINPKLPSSYIILPLSKPPQFKLDSEIACTHGI